MNGITDEELIEMIVDLLKKKNRYILEVIYNFVRNI